ncbi:tail completion protein gp17 [Tsuneonella sp. HG222]
MADFAAALAARLIADAGVSALAGDRVHWSAVPQGKAWPYLRLQALGGSETQVLAGGTGLKRAFVRLDAFGATHASAWSLAQAARAALAGRAEVDGITFVRTEPELARDAGDDIPGVGFVHLVSFATQIDYRGD